MLMLQPRGPMKDKDRWCWMDVSAEDRARVRGMTAAALGDAVRHAFSTMAGMDAEVAGVEDDGPCGDGLRVLVSLIGWVGKWNGTGVLECSPEFGCELTGMLLGDEIHALNEDVLDCLAEFCNIIFGNMKTELEGVVGTLALSTPTVVQGDHVCVWNRGESFQVLPVRIGRHALRLKVLMAPAAAMGAARRSWGGFNPASHS